MRENVNVMDLFIDPDMSKWAERGLRSEIDDDWLLATILEFSEKYPNNKLIFITNDYPVSRKAQGHGIKILDPEGIITKLEADVTTEDKGVKATPKIRLNFLEEGKNVNSVVRSVGNPKPGPPTDEDFGKIITQKRLNLEQILFEANNLNVDNKKIDNFKKNYDRYITTLEKTLKLKRTREFGMNCEIELFMQNSSNILIEQLKIVITFPKEFLIISSYEVNQTIDNFDLIEDLEEPSPIWKSSPYNFDLFAQIPPIPNLPSSLPRPIQASQTTSGGPYYFGINREKVAFSYPRFHPGKKWNMKPLTCFIPPTRKDGFQLSYKIDAENLSDPIEGKLNVILK